ncbi:MAG: superoxide dismutase family protein [Fulvivirga sp.]
MKTVKIFIKTYILTSCFFLLLIGCGKGSEERRQTMEDNNELLETNEDVVGSQDNEDREKTATANITSASGSKVTGQATFTSRGDNKVKFELTVENIAEGSHAVHLHEKGDCSASDAKSAGAHWNPTNEEHGKRGTDAFHKGDIGNMDVGSDGKGSMTMTIEGWCVGGAADCDILNKAVIIHAKGDDFVSQPSGAAGDRIGCGVIEKQ